MGSQVNFYLVGEDEARFCEYVLSDPAVSVLYAVRTTDPFVKVETPLPPADESFCGMFALWNEAIAPKEIVTPKHKVKSVDAVDGIWDIDAFVRPVIEMIRCSQMSDGLRPGRIWARFDHSKLTPDQQREFRNWFQRLARWLNKLPYRWDMYRIGPKTKEFFDSGGKAIGYGLGEITEIKTSDDVAVVRRKPSIHQFSPEVERDDGQTDVTITLDPNDPDHSGFG